MKSIRNKKTGLNKKLLLMLSALLMFSLALLPNVLAQDYTDINVTLEVGEGQFAELTVDGCWVDTAGTWGWSGTGVSLLQPGDRENGIEIGDRWTWYDTWGGAANGNATGTNTNAFAYGDCKFTVTVTNYTNYQIQYYGDDFDDGAGHYIPDMVGYDTSGFNFTIESEDPDDPTHANKYPYASGQGEHGFFIVDTDIAVIEDDTTYDGDPDYAVSKTYDAANCGTDSDRPCYHQITALGSGYEKILVDSAGDLTDATIEIRTAFGSSGLTAGDYTMTQTMAFVSPP